MFEENIAGINIMSEFPNKCCMYVLTDKEAMLFYLSNKDEVDKLKMAKENIYAWYEFSMSLSEVAMVKLNITAKY